MSVVDPIFGRTAVNAASSCGCTCTQTTPTAPSFNSVWTGERDSGGGCACTCRTPVGCALSPSTTMSPTTRFRNSSLHRVQSTEGGKAIRLSLLLVSEK